MTKRLVPAALAVAALAATAGGMADAARPTSPPVVRSLPSIAGGAVVGRVLTAVEGGWGGTQPFTFAYQWLQCDRGGNNCLGVTGATNKTFTLASNNLDRRLRVRVTARNAEGSVAALSRETAVVRVASPPVVRGLPSIAGSAIEGRVLTAREGSWGGTRPFKFAYQWLQCDAAGGECLGIATATNRNFTLASNNVGRRMRVRVTARNDDGSVSAVSGPSSLVRAANAPPPPPPPPAGPSGQIRLADGRTSIPVTSVGSPERLIVSGVAFAPSPVRSRAPFAATFRITDTRGYVVRDALVYMTGIPFGRIVQPAEATTNTEGYAVFQVQPTPRLPLVRGAALVVFVRARRSGEPLLAGISTRRLVQVRLGAP